MTEFADEARDRAAHLLRMARTDDPRVRARLVHYATTTPDPPALGPGGITTTGCPRCRNTMWQQRDAGSPIWVCGACGHVEDVTMTCPHCTVSMKPPVAGWPDRWSCPSCPRVAATGESAAEIEDRERGRVEAIGLLDAALAARAS